MTRNLTLEHFDAILQAAKAAPTIPVDIEQPRRPRLKTSELGVGRFYMGSKGDIRAIESIIDGVVYYQDGWFYAQCQPKSFCQWASHEVSADEMGRDPRTGRTDSVGRLIEVFRDRSSDIPMAGFPQWLTGVYAPRQTVLPADARPLVEAMMGRLTDDRTGKLRTVRPEDLRKGAYYLDAQGLSSVRWIDRLLDTEVHWVDRNGKGACSRTQFCEWASEAVVPDTTTYCLILSRQNKFLG